MNLAEVMDELGQRLNTISGLRVFTFPPDNITPPAAIISYPDEITYDETYGRGLDKISIPVVVVVGRASDRASRNNLAKYVAGSGSSSVKAVVESGTYNKFHSVRVMRAEFDVIRIASIDYIAALFDLDVAGQGA